MTSVADLKALGAFVDSAPVEREIKFTIAGVESTAKIWVRRQTLGQQERMFRQSNAESKSDPKFTAIMVSQLVLLGENASEQLDLEQAYSLHPAIGNAMIDAINEVSGFAKAGN